MELICVSVLIAGLGRSSIKASIQGDFEDSLYSDL